MLGWAGAEFQGLPLLLGVGAGEDAAILPAQEVALLPPHTPPPPELPCRALLLADSFSCRSFSTLASSAWISARLFTLAAPLPPLTVAQLIVLAARCLRSSSSLHLASSLPRASSTSCAARCSLSLSASLRWISARLSWSPSVVLPSCSFLAQGASFASRSCCSLSCSSRSRRSLWSSCSLARAST